MMNFYRREDGTICKAIQFTGGSETENLFEVTDILKKADLLPLWKQEVVTDEWAENEAGDDYEQVVIPEHIKIGAGNDALQLGDYIVERDGDVYIMGGALFEAIWSPIDDVKELEQPKNIKIADICLHCGRSVVNFDTNGTVYKGFKHTEGKQRNLIRCWPEDTGQPYGLDATPRSHKNV